MKKLHTLPTLAIAAALLVPALNAQQSSSSTSSRTQAEQSMNPSSQAHRMQQSGGSTGQLRRVSDDSVEREFTASDLIGKGVYDQQGEKIGNITDISVEQSLAQKFSQAAKGKSSREYSSSDTSKKGNKSARSMGHDMSDDDSELQSRQASSEQGWNRDDSDQLSNRASSDLQSNRSSSDWQSNRGDSGLQTNRGGGETTVFISVGGLWGLGSDIVSAPASALSFDQEEDRFTMSYSKEDVVALAEREAEDYSSSASYDYGAGSDQYDSDRTMSGSQRWSEDVSGIREALRSDDQLSGQAAGIIVTSEGDKVHLRGTVSSNAQKKRAEKLAKEHTKQDVENSITVRD